VVIKKGVVMFKNDSKTICIFVHYPVPDSVHNLAYFLVDIQCVAAIIERMDRGYKPLSPRTTFTSRRLTSRYKDAGTITRISEGSIVIDICVGFATALLFYYIQLKILDPIYRKNNPTPKRRPKAMLKFRSEDEKQFRSICRRIPKNNFDAAINESKKLINYRYPDTPDGNRALKRALERVRDELIRANSR